MNYLRYLWWAFKCWLYHTPRIVIKADHPVTVQIPNLWLPVAVLNDGPEVITIDVTGSDQPKTVLKPRERVYLLQGFAIRP